MKRRRIRKRGDIKAKRASKSMYGKEKCPKCGNESFQKGSFRCPYCRGRVNPRAVRRASLQKKKG